MKHAALATLACVMASSALAQVSTGAPAATNGTPPRPPRYVEPAPYDFARSGDGWQSMFDGKTFAGWVGPMEYWRIENGSIVSSSTAANPNGSVYLFWAGGDLKNFEFKTDIKLEGEGANSGVQFRAVMLGKTEKANSEWESRGYQADFDYVNEQTGALIECCAGPRRGVPPRPFKASMGMVLRSELAPGGLPEVIGSTGDPVELKKSVHAGGWNELHLIVRGTTMFYFLNGRLMSAFVDDDPTMFVDRGRLAIQLEGRGDTKVSYRNLRLKLLP